jgi:hypothetical protein
MKVDAFSALKKGAAASGVKKSATKPKSPVREASPKKEPTPVKQAPMDVEDEDEIVPATKKGSKSKYKYIEDE